MVKEEKEEYIQPILPTKNPTLEELVGVSAKFANNFKDSLCYDGLYKSMGINPDKTFLINGPPGTGKTYTINALNNSINEKTYELLNLAESGQYLVPENDYNPYKMELFTMSYDIGKMGTAYINMGSRKIQDFFDQCYKMSNVAPVLIKLDEADALLAKRGGTHSHKEDDKVLETIMKNLQTSHDMDNMYVVMMTNLKENIDPAVLRAGRIDRHYLFDLPNLEERFLLYDRMIDKINNKAKYNVIRNYNSYELSEKSKGFNNADIYAVIENTLRNKVKYMIQNKEPGIIRAGYVTQKGLHDSILNHKKEFKTEKTYKSNRIGFI